MGYYDFVYIREELSEMMTSEQYMQACEPFEASCVKCGIVMAKWYNEDGFQNGEYWCCNCGLSITKKVVYLDAKDKYTISYLTKVSKCKEVSQS